MSKKFAPRSDDPWDKETEREREPWFNRISFPNLTEPTIIIALITSLYYVFISGYYISYFHRLSIPFYALDLPFSFYLNAGYKILYYSYYILLLATLFGSLNISLKLRSDLTRDKKLLFMTICLWILFLSLLLTCFSFIKNLSLILFILLLLAHIYVYPYHDYKIKNFKNFNNYISIFIFICIIMPGMFGAYDAEKLIAGDAGSFEAKLTLNNVSPDVSNKNLMFIIHSDSKYYLVEKNKTLPKKVNTYIIPDGQIKMIIVKSVEEEHREFYEFYKDWRLI